MADPVVIENKPFWPAVMAVLWLAGAAAGVVFAATGVHWLGPAENGAAVLLMLMGGVLAASGVVMAHVSWRSARIRGAVLELSDDGFRDRRLNDIVVPWKDLTWKVVFNGRVYSLQFDLAEQARAKFPVAWSFRALAILNRCFRLPEYPVLTMGTGLRAHQIAHMMNRYTAAKD